MSAWRLNFSVYRALVQQQKKIAAGLEISLNLTVRKKKVCAKNVNINIKKGSINTYDDIHLNSKNCGKNNVRSNSKVPNSEFQGLFSNSRIIWIHRKMAKKDSLIKWFLFLSLISIFETLYFIKSCSMCVESRNVFSPMWHCNSEARRYFKVC